MPPTATPAELERLLQVQEHDTELDRLRHRRDALTQRGELAARRARRTEVEAHVAERSARREDLATDERRLAREAAAVTERMEEVDRTLYSGSVTSPRELQALQHEMEQLRRHRDTIEDRELELMEQGEALDTERAALRAEVEEIDAAIDELSGSLQRAEAEVDAAIAAESDARAVEAAEVGDALLADYERRGARNRRRPGIGIARLVGTSCQGCGLGIPAVEADAFRRAPAGTVCEPEDCDCILVP